MRLAVLGCLVATAGCYDFGRLGQSLCQTDSNAQCDDFESGAIDDSRWRTLVTAGSSVTVDKVHAHSGSYALHALLKPATPMVISAQIFARPTFEPAPRLFVRGWFYIPTDEASRLLTYSSTSNEELDLVSNHQLVETSDSVGADAGAPNRLIGTVGPPLDTWTCIELEVDTTIPGTRVFVDGNIVPELSPVQNVSANPPLSQVGIGTAQGVPPNPGAEVFVDDVVISPHGFIGCGPPQPAAH